VRSWLNSGPNALEGIALEGIALEGIALEGIALEGIALEGIALEGIALEGIALRARDALGVSETCVDRMATTPPTVAATTPPTRTHGTNSLLLRPAGPETAVFPAIVPDPEIAACAAVEPGTTTPRLATALTVNSGASPERILARRSAPGRTPRASSNPTTKLSGRPFVAAPQRGGSCSWVTKRPRETAASHRE